MIVWHDWRDHLGKEQDRDHRGWLKRGRQGPGRIELTDVDLSGVVTSGSNWTAARFVRCRFDTARVNYTRFIEADLEGCTAERADLSTSHFDHGRLVDCSFAGCDFLITTFLGTRISGCDWSDAQLGRSSWNRAVVERTRFRKSAIFAAQLRDFAKVSAFDAWFADHRAYHERVVGVLRTLVEAEHPVSWFDARFGKAQARFSVVPGAISANWSFSVRVRHASAPTEMYQVMGLWRPDGLPVASVGTLSVLVHEMAHAYVNPIFDRHEAELAPAGKVIYPLVARRMVKQGYTTWQNVARESAVRASVILFLRDRKGEVAAAHEALYQAHCAFPWAGELAEVMARIPSGALEAHVADLGRAFEAIAARYANGIPATPFGGPVDAAVLGDPVFVAPADPELAARLQRLHDSVNSEAPVVPAGDGVLAAHPNKDIVLYGAASDPLVADVLARGHWQIDASGISIGDKRFTGPHLVLVVAAPRPDDPQHGIAVYTAADANDIGEMAVFHGLTDWSVFRHTEQGYELVDAHDFVP